MTESLLTDQFQAAQTEADLRQAVRATSAALDLPLYNLAYLAHAGRGSPHVIRFDNVPDAFREGHLSSANGRKDPVLQHAFSCTTPILYDQGTYAGAGAGDLWDEQAEYGYHNGIGVSVRLGQGRLILLGFDSPDRIAPGAQFRTRLLATLLTTAISAAGACERVLSHEIEAAKRRQMPVDLTDRELQVLYLASLGRSSKETAQALGISSYTVEGHLRSAMAKLGTTRKTEAVMAALRMELISDHIFSHLDRNKRTHTG